MNPVAEKLDLALDAAEYGQWAEAEELAHEAAQMARRRAKLEAVQAEGKGR